jgi:hypothetical protein
MVFKLQIVRAEDTAIPAAVVTLPGGGALETDLVQDAAEAALRHQVGPLDRATVRAQLEDAIVAQGVGIFRTEAQVRQAIRTGLDTVLTMQEQTLHDSLVHGLTSAVAALKAKTKKVIRGR